MSKFGLVESDGYLGLRRLGLALSSVCGCLKKCRIFLELDLWVFSVRELLGIGWIGSRGWTQRRDGTKRENPTAPT